MIYVRAHITTVQKIVNFTWVEKITIRTNFVLPVITDLKLYHGESWELLIRRWAKLEKDFKLKSGNYDISKIPDIYDCIKYDLQHNQKTLQYDRAEELFMYSKALADIVIPQVINEPRRQKTGLRGFRPGPTQTGLYSHRRWLET